MRAFDALRALWRNVISPSSDAKTAPPIRGCAAQACQDRAAKPLYGDPAAIDHRGFGAIHGKRRLVTEIDDPGFASVAAPA